MRYYVPDMDDIEEALKFIKKLDEPISDNKVIFDFSNTYTFTPFPMLVIGASIRYCREQNKNFRFYIYGAEGKSYPGTMGFFKYISERIDFGLSPGEANGSNNYIPITLINFNDHRLGIEETEKQIEIKSDKLATVIDRGNKELHEVLTYLIRESIRNIPEHAKTNNVWVCAQGWPSKEIAEIAIVDDGIGIYKSIIGNAAHKYYIDDNAHALEWSLRAGISEAFRPSKKQNSYNDVWENSGFGLYMVSEICKYLNGRFCIASYGNYIVIDKDGVYKGETSYKGTAINIRLPIKEIDNAQDIIDLIATHGEKQARTIRNAFKHASKPSRGLIGRL